MSLDAHLVDYKGDIGKFAGVKQVEHVTMEVCLGDLHADVEHPDVIERELTVVAAEDVELAFDDVGGVTTPGPGSVLARLHFFPVALLDVVNVHVVHPVSTVVATKVVYLRVH